MKLKVLELFDGLKIKVSEDGKIYTFDHNVIRKNGRLDDRKGKQLKPGIDKYGYERVVLTKNGIRKTYLVHRLVALAYIPNIENKPTVNHKDGNKRNNNVSNLEWATHKEQKTHEIKNGLCDKNIEALKISNKKRAIPIIFKENKYSSVREASRKTGICQWTIRKYGREVMPNE